MSNEKKTGKNEVNNNVVVGLSNVEKEKISDLALINGIVFDVDSFKGGYKDALIGVKKLIDAKSDEKLKTTLASRPAQRTKDLESLQLVLFGKFVGLNKRFPTQSEWIKACGSSLEAWDKKGSTGNFCRQLYLGLALSGILGEKVADFEEVRKILGK